MKKIPFLEGIKEFKNLHFRENEILFKELVDKGQNPKALFIGCSDSRIIPTLITNSKPGDLFVIRNIGNMVPPFKPDNDFHGTAAAIEYAVSILNVEDIIVCGHSNCGMCRALYEEDKIQGIELIHVKNWLRLGKDVKETVLKIYKNNPDINIYELTEKINILYQLKNLLTYPKIKEKVESGELRLHGWYYKIETGEIEFYNSDTNSFELVL
ncbi:MAG: carbonic anhydrase [Persephonella sp.]|nr:MAG: carbonic anhydrase [Persephonella sp.]